MNTKLVAIIAAVVVVVAGAAAAVFMLNNGDKGETHDENFRLYIYGNANGDNNLDQKDVDTLNKIIKDGTWDKKTNPYADANQDGNIDSKDVEAVQNFIAGKSQKMYYMSSEWDVRDLMFPLDSSKIAVTLDYGLIVCSILGIYDKVAGVEHKLLAKGEIRYPGLHGLQDLSDQRKDATNFIDNIVSNNYTVVMGRPYLDTYTDLKNSPSPCEHIMLNYTKDYGNGMDNISALLMTSYMFNIPAKGHAYCDYFDKIVNNISDKVGNATAKTFIMPYADVPFETDVTEVTVETEATTGGSYGTYWFASLLPLENKAEKAVDGEYSMLLENIITADPDYIFVTLWGINDDDAPETAQAYFDDFAKIFEKTRAYREGHIYGMSYEAVGTQLAVGSLPLLASYIWPDTFSHEDGYKVLQETYDNYSDLKDGVDVKTLGGLLVYQANTKA
ncbi:MAG: hypothetical protein MJZ38_01055 [archaeon]|nr:hypothetical protein [archaeon]